MQKEKTEDIKKKSLICTKPFENVEIDSEGNIFSCCPDYKKTNNLGNIFEKSFEDIWFGENFDKLRQDVISDRYSDCILDYCYNVENFAFKNKSTYLKNKPQYPKSVTISVDETCNAKCIFCRDKTVLPDKEKMNKLMKMIDNCFIPMLQNAETVLIDGCGEIFCSKFGKQLIKKACNIYPNIKFEILTNGYLCNEKNLKELGLYNNLALVTLSLHATTKKTYQKIVKNIDFDTVIENIKYLSELKNSKKLQYFYLTFVATSLNYKEIPDFVDFAYSVGATPQIWAVRNYSISGENKNFKSLNVLDEKHPEHENFIKVLHNSVFEKYSIVSDFLFDYNEKMKSYYDK